jgi:hypothetical protein
MPANTRGSSFFAPAPARAAPADGDGSFAARFSSRAAEAGDRFHASLDAGLLLDEWVDELFFRCRLDSANQLARPQAAG